MVWQTCNFFVCFVITGIIINNIDKKKFFFLDSAGPCFPTSTVGGRLHRRLHGRLISTTLAQRLGGRKFFVSSTPTNGTYRPPVRSKFIIFIIMIIIILSIYVCPLSDTTCHQKQKRYERLAFLIYIYFFLFTVSLQNGWRWRRVGRWCWPGRRWTWCALLGETSDPSDPWCQTRYGKFLPCFIIIVIIISL